MTANWLEREARRRVRLKRKALAWRFFIFACSILSIANSVVLGKQLIKPLQNDVVAAREQP